MKSGSTYDELRKSGIIILPTRRTLRDYKNAIKPETGFNSEVICELIRKCEHFNELEKYIVVSFDEVKIQSDLVFDKHSGKVIGFVDVGDKNVNMATFADLEALATHVLSFQVRDLYGNFKFNLDYFATNSILSHQLKPIFWKAVSILEIGCKLKVIAAVCGRTAPNQCFFNMHASITGNSTSGMIYRTKSLYSPDRFICFFSDYPHLIKTSRNCLFHSGFGESFSR